MHGLELVLVEEVERAALLAEEEPVVAGGAEGLALFEERAEGRDAGAGADHDDGRGGVFGQAEVGVRVQEDGHGARRRGARSPRWPQARPWRSRPWDS